MIPRIRLATLGQWGGIALIAVAVGILFVPLVGRAIEQPPITWTNAPFQTSDPIPVRGPLATYVERCNTTDHTIMTTVARQLIEESTGQVFILLPTAWIINPGCTAQTGGTDLPSTVGPGEYHIEYLVQFDGWFRTFAVPLRSQSFTVQGGQ